MSHRPNQQSITIVTVTRAEQSRLGVWGLGLGVAAAVAGGAASSSYHGTGENRVANHVEVNGRTGQRRVNGDPWTGQ